ncbi:MAG TPA: aldehyde dehydrogenase family protein [Pseudogracilibacillus sp.]|nr:aldehyde dehydrogenase family protein [Pseudogracilibacillus sp.]
MEDKYLIKVEAMLETRVNNHDLLTVLERKHILKQLKHMLIEEEFIFLEALKIDLKKSAFEAYASEFAVLLNEIDYVLKNIDKWSKEKSSYRFKIGTIEKVEKNREAYGTVLVISPWNYPLQLALMPVISAISAGNSCVIKPSEHAPATSEALQKLIDVYFPHHQLTVVLGTDEIAKKLIDMPFNLIFFTGSKKTGNLVYQQAAKKQKPVIMELGGKNPCIIDETGFSKENIKEIVWGKYLNSGQTCVAPDILFVHQSIYESALLALKETIVSFYGEMTNETVDYGRIINAEHYNRLEDLLEDGKIYYGGLTKREELFIEPTLLIDINEKSSLLKEEIFGPILPVIPYTDLNELLQQNLLQKDSLVVYLFSKNNKTVNLLKKQMKSTISQNHVIQYATNPYIAFGGNGRSGFGVYHGYAGYTSCSYERAISKSFTYKQMNKKFPPYKKQDLALLRKLRKWLI